MPAAKLADFRQGARNADHPQSPRSLTMYFLCLNHKILFSHPYLLFAGPSTCCETCTPSFEILGNSLQVPSQPTCQTTSLGEATNRRRNSRAMTLARHGYEYHVQPQKACIPNASMTTKAQRPPLTCFRDTSHSTNRASDHEDSIHIAASFLAQSRSTPTSIFSAKVARLPQHKFPLAQRHHKLHRHTILRTRRSVHRKVFHPYTQRHAQRNPDFPSPTT
jgi:hypothetical protein